MSKKTLFSIFTTVFIMVVVLIYGCATSSKTAYYGRTMFIPLKSSPDGAKILIDGEQKGFTPVTVKFFYLHDSRGEHDDETRERTLTIVKDGYEPYSISFSIKGKEYEKIPSPILLRQLDDNVETIESRSEDQQMTQELEEEQDKIQEIPVKADKKERVEGAIAETEAIMNVEEAIRAMKEEEKEVVSLKRKDVSEEIKQDGITTSDDQGGDKTGYTIQAGSFITVKRAEKQFLMIIQDLHEEYLEDLRIENVEGFYAVRLGIFEDYMSAEKFLETIKKQLSTATILKARMQDNRIIKLYRRATSSAPSKIQNFR
jgi:hypothetical protein